MKKNVMVQVVFTCAKNICTIMAILNDEGEENL